MITEKYYSTLSKQNSLMGIVNLFSFENKWPFLIFESLNTKFSNSNLGSLIILLPISNKQIDPFRSGKYYASIVPEIKSAAILASLKTEKFSKLKIG